MEIIRENFEKKTTQDLSDEKYGVNWPVVYILESETEAYVGETTSITNRLKQHLDNKDRANLQKVNIIFDEKFNKSAVLDIESKLIEYMSADKKFKLQNSNSGMRNHNYYDKEVYEAIFIEVWNELLKNKVVQNDLEMLINSDLFKYTPYKRLTQDQYYVLRETVLDILLSVKMGQSSTTLINGEAGTGKTVMAMYLVKLFTDGRLIDFIAEEDEYLVEKFESVQEEIRGFKVGLVIPMSSLRVTLKQVVRNIKGLSSKMIIGPNDVVKNNYDLLIVDESHRLLRRVSIMSYGSYDSVNKKLGLDVEGTQLDWIVNSSKHIVLFYDETQSVRPSDVRREDFIKLTEMENYAMHSVESQLRVIGGSDYIKYVNELLNHKPPSKRKDFSGYDLKLFDSVSDMKKEILLRNNEHGLSRLVAGFAWPWKTKNIKPTEALKNSIYDIVIDNEKLIWNSTTRGWVIHENAINEVGSIHTVQGYDLNYAGVIIGPDIRYDVLTQKIEVSIENYHDVKGKTSLASVEELETYIKNIYKVLLTRGVKGTYIYVCDKNLRNYFAKYIDTFVK